MPAVKQSPRRPTNPRWPSCVYPLEAQPSHRQQNRSRLMPLRILFILFCLCLACSHGAAVAQGGQPATRPATRPAAPPEPGFALTVYSTADPAFDWATWNQQRTANRGYYGYNNPYNVFPGYGVVRETRNVTLDAGRNNIRFTGVAASIDPTTLQFRSFTDPAAAILEQ